jgi:hypothetical protein
VSTPLTDNRIYGIYLITKIISGRFLLLGLFRGREIVSLHVTLCKEEIAKTE